jgi:phosphatidylglycerol:prolipoprotein diacylglycerol transferase
MVHNFDPFLWQIYGNFGVRWYGMAYLAGFICAYFLIHKMALRNKAQIPVRLVSDFITYSAIGILIGGRVGYVLFYSPELLWQFKSELPFWGVLAVNEGGMASHGGILGLILACMLFARANRLNTLHLLDWASICGPIGIFFGRIANFINGELVGRPAPADFPLGIKFPSDIFLWPSQEPAKMRDLATVVEKLGVGRESWLSLVEKSHTEFASQMSVHEMLNKIVLAIQEGNQAVTDAIAPLLVLRHPSQLYAAAGEGLLLFILLGLVWYKPRKPGVIAALCVVFYAIIRIVDEQFRMPDAQIGFGFMGLTRGQMLSGVMFGIGLFLLLFWGRRMAQPLGGWGRQYR